MSVGGHTEEQLDAGESEMGPGVDLTISLLALVLLVLVVMVGNYETVLAQVQRRSEMFATEARSLRQNLEELTTTLQAARVRLRALEPQDAEPGRQRASAAEAWRKVIQLQLELEELRRKLAEANNLAQRLEQERNQIREEAAATLTEIGRLRAASAESQNHNSYNLPVIRFEQSRRSDFEANQAELIDGARSSIQAEMPRLLAAVRDRKANRLTITGSSSPTPRPSQNALVNVRDARDSNIDLSVARALSVAHFLASLGVPYRCLIVTGQGTNRTRMPVQEQMRLSPQDREAIQATEARYADERNVFIYADQDADSTCPPELLLNSLE